MNRYQGVVISVLFILTGPVWTISCSSSKESTVASVEESQAPPSSRIIFLNYHMERDSLLGYNIELINKTISNGAVKPGLHHHTSGKEGDLRCSTLDANQQSISDLLIPDPLTKRIEYLEEGNRLASKQIILDQVEFSVRLQLDDSASFVAIERINPSGNTQLIITEIDQP